MAVIGKSAKLYQERKGLNRATRRGPGPRVNLADSEIHDQGLRSPLPIPSLLRDAPGMNPPDTGHTAVWAHGEESII